ncbi:alpha-galactosidase [Paenibacillus sp. BSR1-1]|uniref:alpha-galactosidase n=1 Tax=Paenibacillus sp. BSR1-1 TaxID=3020845 RepID=UPI0025AF78F6|nr:alpha-galactosidase [Paenibacillus sp. BSR1-1]MDN3016888.1 alpha-galactosidase [Paenibacillus sp. BSR1-1]
MLKKVITSLLMCTFILAGNFPFSIIDSDKVEASSYNTLAQRPFMGWSSWSSIRKKPTEENIKAAAYIMAAKFKSHGYEYVNLDDYYQLDWTTTVDKYGRWVVDPKKFPNGMKAVGDYIHKKGLKFGLYVTLGIPKGAIDQNTPIEGTPFHAKDIVDLSMGQKVSFNFDNMYSIDYSKPGAQEYINSWARLFASYGVDYLKIDGVRNQDIPDIEAWATALEKTERPIHVELSNNLDIHHISTWQQLSNGWRTDHDVEAYGTPTNTNWKKVSRRFSDVANWQPHAGPGGWNDLDSLNVANGSKDGLTEDEKRSYISLWAIAASHFVIGNDLTKLDNYGISLLTNDEIIGVNQSGIPGKRLFKTDDSQVFYQKLQDGSYNIGLFNTGTLTQKVTVNWSDLGIQGPAIVHDMWSHQDLGSEDSGFTARLATHDSRMIHVVPASSPAVSPKSGEIEVAPSKVSLNWEAKSGVDSYHVLVAADPIFKNIVSDQIISSPSIDLADLETGTQYYWKLSTVSEGSEKQIGIYSFHTKVTTAPDSPDWVLANRKNKDSVSLSWNPTFGTASYTVFRKEINRFGVSSSYKPIASNLTNPNYVDKAAPLSKWTHYSYVVTAKNANGTSKMSPIAQTYTSTFTTQLAILLIVLILVLLSALGIANKKFKLIAQRLFRKQKNFGQEEVWD